MKKLLIALVALTMTASAFAHGHSMVKLNFCFDGTCDNLNLGMSNDDTKDAEVKTQNIALNYAMAFGGNFGAGLTYITSDKTTDGDVTTVGDKYNTIGLSFYWNKDGSFSDSCFAALHYDMKTTDDRADKDNNNDGDTTDTGESGKDSGHKNTTITLEYGHRYNLGKLMGVNWNYSPSVTYAMDTKAPSADGADDVKTNTLAINAVNFAATF